MKEAFIKLHLSILLAGCTGLFGKLISMNEVDIVWYRLVLTTLILLVFTGFTRISWHDLWRTAICGTLLALHWMLFYGSIKMSNVSIGVLCYSLVGLFTAIVEPIAYRRKISVSELLYSLLPMVGLLFIFSFDARHRSGILMGVASSFVAAVFMVASKMTSAGMRSRTFLFYEMAGAIVPFTLLAPVYLYFFPSNTPVVALPTTTDLIWMGCHALFCTVGMYLLQLQALKKLSAFTVNLSYNLEPVYSIILAMIFFHEARELNASFYVGLGLILLSVVLQSHRAFLRQKT